MSEGWWLEADHNDDRHTHQLTVISMDLPGLRARARALQATPRGTASEDGVRELLRTAHAVDGRLQEWASTLPTDWLPRTISYVPEVSDDELATAPAWPGPQTVYPEVYASSMFNDHRIHRIICQDIVMQCAAWLDPAGCEAVTLADAAQAAWTIRQMVDDMSASVPFHMDYDLQTLARAVGQDQHGTYSLGHCLRAVELAWLTRASSRRRPGSFSPCAAHGRRNQVRGGAASPAAMAGRPLGAH